MKILSIIAVVLLIVVFCITGFASFHGTNESIWAGGLWIIPTLTQAGALWFLVIAFEASKSGSQRYDKPTHRTVYDNVNVSIFKVAQFIYFVCLTFLTSAIMIFQYCER
jgi:uncharacterized membrane protein